MTTEEVKQIIFDSKIDAGLKQRLVLLLPNLGKYTLVGLAQEVSRGDSVIAGEYTVSLWEAFANLLSGLQNKDQNALGNLSKFFNENLYRFTGEQKLYALYFVLDIRALADSERIRIPPEYYNFLLDYESRLFWQLPEDEVLLLFKKHLLYLLQRINLIKDTQVLVYNNDWDLDDNFNESFLDSLYKNDEIFGVNSQKTLGVWFKDFLDFTRTSRSRADAFGVAEFLSKNLTVQKLTKSERDSLAEILKLYAWLLNPELNEEEVLKYKEEIIEKREVEEYNNFLETIKTSGLLQFSVLTAPVPKNAPVLRPMEEIKPQAPIQAPVVQPKPAALAQLPKIQAGSSMTMPQSNLIPKAANLGQKTQAEIDKKLEELEKRIVDK